MQVAPLRHYAMLKLFPFVSHIICWIQMVQATCSSYSSHYLVLLLVLLLF